MNRIPRPVAAVLVAALALAGCGSDSKSSTSTAGSTATSAASATVASAPTAAGAVLTIQSFQFSALTVTAGQEITINNADGVKHTVTADDKTFSVEVPGGGSATLTIATPGTYAIHCEVHSSMKGTIVVN